MNTKKLILLGIGVFPFSIVATSCNQSSITSITAELKLNKVYYANDVINKDAFKVTAKLSDNTTKEINDWTCSELSNEGTYTFTEEDVSATKKVFNFEYLGNKTSLNVFVDPESVVLEKIEAKLDDTEKKFTAGGKISKDEIIVSAIYSNERKTKLESSDWNSDFFEDKLEKTLTTVGTDVSIDINYFNKSTVLKITVIEPGKGNFTVNLLNPDETAIGTKTVTKGSVLARPENPTKGELFFYDWYTEKELVNKYNFDTPVYNDLNLYAGWAPRVTFNTTGFEEQYNSQYVLYGKTITNPGIVTPTKDTDFCNGWKDKLGNLFDFNTKITENITLTPSIISMTQNKLVIAIKEKVEKYGLAIHNLDIDTSTTKYYPIYATLNGESYDVNCLNITSINGLVDIVPSSDGKMKYIKVKDNCPGGLDYLYFEATINDDEVINAMYPLSIFSTEKLSVNVTDHSAFPIDSFATVGSKITDEVVIPSKYIFSRAFPFPTSSGITINELKNFSNHPDITSVKLFKNSQMEEIPTCCFLDCSNLDTVYIPYTLKRIGYHAFYGCDRLAEVVVDSKDIVNLDNLEDTCLFDNACTVKINTSIQDIENSKLVSLLKSKGLERTTTPDIETIEGYVYYEKVTDNLYIRDYKDGYVVGGPWEQIPDSNVYVPNFIACNGTVKKVLALSRAAFNSANAENVESIHLPSSLIHSNYDNVWRCPKLKHINIPRNLDEVSCCCIENNPLLEDIHFDSDSRIRNIGQDGIKGIYKTIRLPQSLLTLDDFCFRECPNLETIRVPKRIKQLCFGFVWECPNLKYVIFDDAYAHWQYKISFEETIWTDVSVKKPEENLRFIRSVGGIQITAGSFYRKVVESI